ncbi:type I methionyl aminopeptidase [Entomospira culicis]|uniref:Methionine aminopeptidase n=1 Tax=Entomospira culicis TaxID=2719989 RepID=A0A968GHV5_9SPIO|nr:type I methionyl aminopeptidase [Entomospira culicis]NIZ18710.1 type I methionyl aminopeptidase [Entomospira culicis]NIZ68925.1 type I methionyl aminopeptidase [Entomospira culicis]WDI37518.1 type I methionyl aminopeptidase [Entomospira culicis]WDI39146.1 type I methionyl aminopeptidase [Entomospira culicis]
MIKLKTKKEIAGIKSSCQLLAGGFRELTPLMRAGVSGLEINQWAEEYAKKHNAKPSFSTYGGFPTATCISVNHCVIHGVPNAQPFKEGDIVGIDFGLELNGFFSDMAITFAIGTISNSAQKLLEDTKASLMLGIEAVDSENGRIQDIGKAISAFLKPKGYGIVHDFCGHGVGLAVHEDPQISHDYPSFGANPRFKEGMVFAIEPMINLGSPDVYVDRKDKWSVYTKDGALSAHFEHTIAITENGIEILTLI